MNNDGSKDWLDHDWTSRFLVGTADIYAGAGKPGAALNTPMHIGTMPDIYVAAGGPLHEIEMEMIRIDGDIDDAWEHQRTWKEKIRRPLRSV